MECGLKDVTQTNPHFLSALICTFVTSALLGGPSGPLHILSLFGTLISRKSISSLSCLFQSSSPCLPLLTTCLATLFVLPTPQLIEATLFLLFLQHLSPFDILYIYRLTGFRVHFMSLPCDFPWFLHSRGWGFGVFCWLLYFQYLEFLMHQNALSFLIFGNNIYLRTLCWETLEVVLKVLKTFQDREKFFMNRCKVKEYPSPPKPLVIAKASGTDSISRHPFYIILAPILGLYSRLEPSEPKPVEWPAR